MTAPPSKTALGLQELRDRSRGLSQRHRTVLLLVDGRRGRHEVLHLARQAGVESRFFDELVELGLVEAPGHVVALTVETAAVPPAALAPSVPMPADAPSVPPNAAGSSPTVDIEIGTDSGPVTAGAQTIYDVVELPEPEVRDAALPAESAVLPHVVPVVLETLEGVVEPPAVGTVTAALDDVPPDAAVVAEPPLPEPAEPRPAPVRVKFSTPVLKPAGPARASGSVPLVALPDALTLREPIEPSVSDTSEDDLLAEVRGLLIGTLLLDAPLSSSLTMLRLRRACERDELIRLIWEIERGLVRSRRPPEAQRRLVRARDLLGLGNTVVHDDSRSAQGRDSGRW